MSLTRVEKALREVFPERPERIQKLLARAGYGSRRKCEEILTAGRVKVDGVVVTELGAKARLAEEEVTVDGRHVRPEEPVYYLLHKPKGVLCTVDDPQDRRTVLDFFPEEKRRIFPVGRLDYESTGAVILTNDGRLTQLLTHPRYGVEKTYEVRVRGIVDDFALNRLRGGVHLSEGKTMPAKVWVLRRKDNETELGLTIHEGRNRQIRRMFAALDFKVRGLSRKRIGAVSLKGLGRGQARRLTTHELEQLVDDASESAEAFRKNKVKPQRKKLPGGLRQGKPDPKIAHALDVARRAADKANEELLDQLEDELLAPEGGAPESGPEPESRDEGRGRGRGRRGSTGPKRGGVPSRRKTSDKSSERSGDRPSGKPGGRGGRGGSKGGARGGGKSRAGSKGRSGASGGRSRGKTGPGKGSGKGPSSGGRSTARKGKKKASRSKGSGGRRGR